MRIILVIGALFALALLPQQLSAGVSVQFDPSDSTIATGITGLEISGMVFDVDFTRAGESFDAIFGAGDPPTTRVPHFYNDATGAAAAADAIAAVLAPTSATRVGDAAATSVFMDIPFRFSSAPTIFVSSESVLVSDGARDSFFILRTAASSIGYALFTKQSLPAVPEASTFATWLLGLSAGAVYVAARCRRSASASATR